MIGVWNLMGGEIRWEALPALSELYGIGSVELLIHCLSQIRSHMQTVAEKTAQVERAQLNKD